MGQRRLPVGAELVRRGEIHFRVWAPRHSRVDVAIEREGAAQRVALTAEGNGYFSGLAHEADAGALYRYHLDGSERGYPDPASRFQPDGPHGPSQVVDPRRIAGPTAHWRGVAREGQVIYEMHVGTFTPEGTWRAAAERAARSWRTLGITVIEVMPVADFPGGSAGATTASICSRRRACTARRTTFARFVDRGARAGHRRHPRRRLQPPRSGRQLSPRSSRRTTSPIATTTNGARRINFDGETAGAGARVLHRERRATGSTNSISTACGSTPRSRSSTSRRTHILTADRRARARGRAGPRSIYLVAENEPQDVQLVRPSKQGGYGLDALWNDDFHHSAMVALTGQQRSVLHRLPRHAAGVRLGREVRLPVSGAVLRVAEASGAARRRSGLAAQRVRQLHLRTTIRSPTRLRGAARASADEPRHAIAR